MSELPDRGERLLRLKDVETKTGLSSTTIYRMMDAGQFPKSLKLTSGTVRWRESKIDAWIISLDQSEPVVAGREVLPAGSALSR